MLYLVCIGGDSGLLLNNSTLFPRTLNRDSRTLNLVPEGSLRLTIHRSTQGSYEYTVYCTLNWSSYGPESARTGSRFI